MNQTKRVSVCLAAITVCLSLLGCRQAGTPAATGEPRPDTSASASTPSALDEATPPAIAVVVSYRFSNREPGFDRTPRIVVAGWKDGRMIWSEKPVEGGPPYRQGRTRPEQITVLLDELERKGLLAGDRPHWRSWGPDAAFTLIGVQDGSRRFRMESWHELYEAGGQVVATAHGLEPLDGRDIKQVLDAQPANYQSSRRLWQHIRDALNAAIPTESEPVAGLDIKQWQLDRFGR